MGLIPAGGRCIAVGFASPPLLTRAAPTLSELIFLTTASFLTAVLSGTLGLGGGSILIVLMLTVMSPAQAIPFHGVIQLVSTGSRVYLFRRETAWPLVLRYSAFLAPGVAVGMLLFQGLSETAIEIAIGVFVLSALYLKRLRVFGDRDTPPAFFYPFGFVVGALSIVVGGVGVLFGPFVVRKGLAKEAIVGTQSSLASATHLAKVVAFGLIGFQFQAHLASFALILPAVILGAIVGRYLLSRVNERAFLWLYHATLIALSLKLILWDGILQVWA